MSKKASRGALPALRDEIVRFVGEKGACYPGLVLDKLSARYPESDVGWEILKLLDKDRAGRALSLDRAGKLVVFGAKAAAPKQARP